MSSPQASALDDEFSAIVGNDNVMTSEIDRYAYSYDAAVLDPVMPGIVVRPTTSEVLGRVVKFCHDNGLPLTVRGAGTTSPAAPSPSRRGGGPHQRPEPHPRNQ